ncbi:hypothetical protein C6380_17465 [Pseudomonas syringae pv. actinidiae]|nr:hypothetical protein C6380_17465 [Pseudomonas syringae pv. actinidiae]
MSDKKEILKVQDVVGEQEAAKPGEPYTSAPLPRARLRLADVWWETSRLGEERPVGAPFKLQATH